MRSALRLGVAGLWLAGACKNDEPQGPAGRTAGPVVARIGDRAVTMADVTDWLAGEPAFTQMRYSTPERRRELLENFVRFEVLAAEARKRGYDRDHEVVRADTERLVADFVRARFDEKVRAEALPHEELAAYLAAHARDFDEVRVSQIVVHDAALAGDIAAKARALAPADEAGFRALVAAHSEDEDSKPRGGDLTYFGRDTKAVPKEVVDAAFGLSGVGAVAGPVRSPEGHHVLRLTGSRLGSARPLTDDHLRKAVAARVLAERRARALDEGAAEMRGRLKVVVDEAKLAELLP